jgi:hypothetical protein
MPPLSGYTIAPATFQTSVGTLDEMTSDVFPGYYQHDSKTIRDNYYCLVMDHFPTMHPSANPSSLIDHILVQDIHGTVREEDILH